jgi:hypothetical protein
VKQTFKRHLKIGLKTNIIRADTSTGQHPQLPDRILIVNITSLLIEHKTTPDLMISDTANSFQFKDVNFIGRYIW